MRKIAVIATIIWLASAQTSYADFADGNKLLNNCRAGNPYLDGYCLGEISNAASSAQE